MRYFLVNGCQSLQVKQWLESLFFFAEFVTGIKLFSFLFIAPCFPFLSHSWLAVLIILAYMAMVIVILLNVLIAQLSYTHSEAKNNAKLQYAIDRIVIVRRIEFSRFARFVSTLNYLRQFSWQSRTQALSLFLPCRRERERERERERKRERPWLDLITLPVRALIPQGGWVI